MASYIQVIKGGGVVECGEHIQEALQAIKLKADPYRVSAQTTIKAMTHKGNDGLNLGKNYVKCGIYAGSGSLSLTFNNRTSARLIYALQTSSRNECCSVIAIQVSDRDKQDASAGTTASTQQTLTCVTIGLFGNCYSPAVGGPSFAWSDDQQEPVPVVSLQYGALGYDMALIEDEPTWYVLPGDGRTESQGIIPGKHFKSFMDEWEKAWKAPSVSP